MPQSHRNQHRPERRAQERQDRDARGCGDRPYSPAAGQQAEIRPHHRGEHEQQIATPSALAPRRSDQGVPREQRDSCEDEPDPGSREEAGLPPGTGPYRVITDLGIYGYSTKTCRMQLQSLHPGVTLDQAHSATGFRLEVAEPVGRTETPTADELRILRDEVDPRRYILGRAQ